MSQKLLVILLIGLVIFLSCKKKTDDKSIFPYQTTVQVYAITSYFTTEKKIKKFLDKTVDITSIGNQEKYNRSLKNIFGARKKSNAFIVHSIDYFISLKKNLITKYYSAKAYEEKYNRFNDNFLIDIKKSSLPNEYWKVTYFLRKQGPLIIYIIEKWINKKQLFKVYFDERGYRIKIINHLQNNESKIEYLESNNLIQTTIKKNRP